MTIDELRVRRRELLARKKYELELQAAGEGDNLALFMVNEELMDVNAQLKALTPQHRVGRRRATHDTFEKGRSPSDRQQYIDWMRADRSYDEEINAAHAVLLDALRESDEVLSERQRQIFALRKSGLGVPEIAARLQLNPSTVSRTLNRAMRRIREDGEHRQIALKVPDARADLSDPEIARAVISALTEKQAVYLYLYYSEWLTLREVGELTGVSHPTILRTMRRGLARIQTVMGGQDIVLENMDAMDDLLFALYQGIQDMGDEAPAEVRAFIRSGPEETYRRRKPEKDKPVGIPGVICESSIGEKYRRGQVPEKKHGQLYQALIERARLLVQAEAQSVRFPVFHWLQKLFRRLKAQSKSKQGGIMHE